MNNLTNIKFKDGDEDEADDIYTSRIVIDVAENGWLVSVEDEEGEEIRHVYQFDSKEEMLKLLQESLGAE